MERNGFEWSGKRNELELHVYFNSSLQGLVGFALFLLKNIECRQHQNCLTHICYLSVQSMDFGYSLKPFHGGRSHEYPQAMV